MRGEDQRSGKPVQLCGPRGQGGRGSPAACDPDDRQRRAGRAVGRVRGAVLAPRPTLDSARAAVAGALAPGLLFDPLGAAAAEQLDDNLLYRWFVGLGNDDPVWHPIAFTTNRDRLLEGEVAAKFLAAALGHARVRQLLSREHFTVEGTLIEAWASLKSFRPKDDQDEPPDGDRNASRDFHGEHRTNGDTHGAEPATPRPPIRMRGCFAKVMVRKHGSAP